MRANRYPLAGARRSKLRLALVALMLGCSPIDLDCGDHESPADCDQPESGAALQGTWLLTAHGSRSGCKDRRLEGALEIETAVPFHVVSDAQPTQGEATGPQPDDETDAFVARIERANFTLEPGEHVPQALRVSGHVTGSCVFFELEETLADGDRLSYRFTGTISSRSVARGQFEGRGPESCTSRGDFVLRIE